FRLLQGIGAEELSARHAWPERFPAQTIRVCDCARRKTEAALSVWASRTAVPANLRERAAQARRDGRNTSPAIGDAPRQCCLPTRPRYHPQRCPPAGDALPRAR